MTTGSTLNAMEIVGHCTHLSATVASTDAMKDCFHIRELPASSIHHSIVSNACARHGPKATPTGKDITALSVHVPSTWSPPRL